MRRFDLFIDRIRRVPPILADAALTVGVMAVGIIELALFTKPQEDTPPYHFSHWSIPFFVLMSLPLVIRRRHIWLTYLLVQGAIVFGTLAHLDSVAGLGAILLSTVLVFSVADRTPAWVAALAAIGGVGFWWLFDLQVRLPNYHPPLLADTIYALPIYGLAAFAGWSQRRRRRLTRELEGRARDVQNEQEAMAAQAVIGERVRIAHELRGLVLDEVERMARLARVARHELVNRSPRAAGQIEAIEATGRRALVDMRRLLLILRRAETQGTPSEDVATPGVNLGAAAAPKWISSAPGAVRSWLQRAWVADLFLVLILAAFMAGEFIVYGPVAGPVFGGWLPVILAAAILSVLLVRRRVPFFVLCVVAVAVFLWDLLQGDSPGASEQALLIAVYTVAAYKNPRWAVAAVALALFSWSPLPAKYRCLCLIDIGTLATMASAAGVAMRGSRILNSELQRQTDLLLQTRGERLQLAIADERTRVAREMHDVVAHAVTVMVVQAGGARMILDTDPALAASTLGDVEAMGIEAITELQTLVDALAPSSSGEEPEPPAESPDVRGLVDRLRRAGQVIYLTEQGLPLPVDAGLHASLYRIVQEALTNARKHAPGAHATVAIRHLPTMVEVDITNEQAPTPVTTAGIPGAGQGLIGILERATVLGGTAEAGPTPDGGFRVCASLPVELVPA